MANGRKSTDKQSTATNTIHLRTDRVRAARGRERWPGLRATRGVAGKVSPPSLAVTVVVLLYIYTI
jgi:hypothetical protein